MYEEDSYNVPPNFLAALLKYRWYLMGSIPLLLLITCAIVVMIPPIYRSEGKVVVETQKIPEELVRSTVTSMASERISIIRERVMTRDNLLEIINRYEPLRPTDDSELTIAKHLKMVRDNIYVDVIESSTGSRSKPVNTIAFSVAFESSMPYVAQAVANDLMTLFLNENVKVRRQRALETTEFLRSEADKIKQSLERTEGEIATFKQENKDALPEHLNLYVDMRERAQTKLSNLERDIRSVREQKKLLETQLSISRSMQGGTVSAEKERLFELQKEYEQLLMAYRSEHPDVVAVKEQIDMLSRVADSGQAEDDAPLTREEVELNQQIVDLESREESLLREKRELETEVADLEDRIVRIPQVERALISLNRENRSKAEQYDSIVSKTLEASMAESLEESLKAERFSILEHAVQPVTPYKPDRKRLLMLALAFSFGLPLSIVLGLGVLDKTIRSPDVLAKLANAPVVMDLRYIPAPGEVAAYRRKIAINMCLILLLVIGAILLVHFLVMPITAVIDKVILRFSGGI